MRFFAIKNSIRSRNNADWDACVFFAINKVYRQKNGLPRSIDRIIQWELTRFDGFFGGGGGKKITMTGLGL